MICTIHYYTCIWDQLWIFIHFYVRGEYNVIMRQYLCGHWSIKSNQKKPRSLSHTRMYNVHSTMRVSEMERERTRENEADILDTSSTRRPILCIQHHVNINHSIFVFFFFFSHPNRFEYGCFLFDLLLWKLCDSRKLRTFPCGLSIFGLFSRCFCC